MKYPCSQILALLILFLSLTEAEAYQSQIKRYCRATENHLIARRGESIDVNVSMPFSSPTVLVSLIGLPIGVCRVRIDAPESSRSFVQIPKLFLNPNSNWCSISGIEVLIRGPVSEFSDLTFKDERGVLGTFTCSNVAPSRPPLHGPINPR